jgi:polyketide synthase PksN
MFSAKVGGVESLYAVFGGRQVDFVWLTSSLSTVLGGLGFASYSAANLYMEHFVASRSGQLGQWRCVALGGMALSPQQVSQQSRGGERQLLTPQEVAMLLEWSLVGEDCPLVVESPQPLGQRLAHSFTGRGTGPQAGAGLEGEGAGVAAGQAPPASQPVLQGRPDLSRAYCPPAGQSEQRLQAVFESFFEMHPIGVEDEFFELGGDSLKGMMLLKRIKKEFNVNLPLKEFFERRTIRSVAAALDEYLWVHSDADMEHEIII